MKNIMTVAILSTLALSLAACKPADTATPAAAPEAPAAAPVAPAAPAN